MAPNGNKDTILREHKVVAVEWGEGQSLYQGTYHSSVGVLSLFSYQRTSRTIMVVEQMYMRKPTGLLLLSYIEDLILEAGVYGIRSIQRVRSQLGMVHVSDVCSADGIKMDRFFVTTYTSKYRNIYD